MVDLRQRKKPVNVCVDEGLLNAARAIKLNLSQTLEEALVKAIREEKRRQWLAENRAAIEDFNARIDRHGVFSDGLRRF